MDALRFVTLFRVSIIVSVVFSFSAHAKKIPIDPKPTKMIPVQDMSCLQAQRFAVKHGYYWKLAGGNDIVAMYPIETEPTELRCPVKHSAAPVVEATLDDDECLMNWYCRTP